MKEININQVYEKVQAGQPVTELESNAIKTPIVPDNIFNIVIKPNGEEFKRWINVETMTKWLSEVGQNAQNPETPIEEKPIQHTEFYGQFVGLIQEINKNRSELRKGFEVSGGNIIVNGVNYKISLQGTEQIESLLEALTTIRDNALPMNVSKPKTFRSSISSYYYNTDEQIDAEVDAKREEVGIVRLSGMDR